MLIATVYLLHFDRPIWGSDAALHGVHPQPALSAYGPTRDGDGGVTTRRAFDQGIGFTLARVWRPGTLRLDRQVKALTWAFTLERVTGIEPALSAWEADRTGPLTALTWIVDAR